MTKWKGTQWRWQRTTKLTHYVLKKWKITLVKTSYYLINFNHLCKKKIYKENIWVFILLKQIPDHNLLWIFRVKDEKMWQSLKDNLEIKTFSFVVVKSVGGGTRYKPNFQLIFWIHQLKQTRILSRLQVYMDVEKVWSVFNLSENKTKMLVLHRSIFV